MEYSVSYDLLYITGTENLERNYVFIFLDAFVLETNVLIIYQEYTKRAYYNCCFSHFNLRNSIPDPVEFQVKCEFRMPKLV